MYSTDNTKRPLSEDKIERNWILIYVRLTILETIQFHRITFENDIAYVSYIRMSDVLRIRRLNQSKTHTSSLQTKINHSTSI